MDVITNLDQLPTLLATRLDSVEIMFLRRAAHQLTGVQDADHFDDITEFQLFAWDEGCPEAASLAQTFWYWGFRSWAAIDRVADYKYNALSTLLNLDLQTERGAYEMSRISDFAQVHSKMRDLRTILQSALPVPRMDINVASTSQSNKSWNKHPKKVEDWYGFDEDVLKYKEIMPRTKRRFTSSWSTGEGPANLYSVSRLFDEQIGCNINAGVKYGRRAELLEKHGKVYGLWESQGTAVPTDEEIFDKARADDEHKADDALRERLEKAFLENAHAAAKIKVKINSIYDHLLKEGDYTLPGYKRRGRAVAVLRRLERFMYQLRLGNQDWATQLPPPLVYLWNNPDDTALCANAIGVIDQWNQYASELGIRHGIIFTPMWTWALEADGENNLRISRGFRYNSTNPSLKEVVDIVTHRALSSDGICKPWKTSRTHPHRQPVDNAMVGPANRTHSRTSASQAPQSPQSSAARSSSTMDVDPPQRVLGGDFSGNDSRPESKEAFRLAQVAAALEVEWIRGVLGRGALGEVFRARENLECLGTSCAPQVELG